ncbi:hypothetical protein ERJ75_000579000 [Trypanosoma vivax]|nr:hypothetical protein ERJ75_000579000 [Trypanosoma vivax]
MTAEAGRPEEQVRRQDAEPNVWALVWFMGNLVALLCLCRLALELLEKIAGKLFTFLLGSEPNVRPAGERQDWTAQARRHRSNTTLSG